MPSRPRTDGKLSESQEQKAVISWWATAHQLYRLPEFALFAIANGAVLAGNAQRRAIQMNNLKATGLRVGVPDLFLSVPRFDIGAGGLYIEMKVRPNKPSESQLIVVDGFRRLGYHAVIAYGADEAIRAISAYLRSVAK